MLHHSIVKQLSVGGVLGCNALKRIVRAIAKEIECATHIHIFKRGGIHNGQIYRAALRVARALCNISGKQSGFIVE